MIHIDRPRTVGELIRDTVVLWIARWPTYLAIGFAVVTPVYVAVFGLGLSDLSGRFDRSPSQGLAFLEGGVLFAFILPLVTAMVANALRPSVSTGRALQAGLERFAPALATAVLAIAAAFAGLLALVLPGLYLTVRLSLAVPAVGIEDLRPAAALRRSWQLTARDGFVRVLGLMLLALALIGLAEGVVELPATALAKSADREGIRLAGQIISYAVTLPIAAIAATLIFADARARQAA